MSSDSGAPKGYSVPRHELKAASKRCQHCQSTAHWSYECPDKKSAKKTSTARSGPKLSPSLMLKYGIQKKRVLFEPEKTEAEVFNEEMTELEKQAREMEKRVRATATPETSADETQPTPRVKAEPSATQVKQEVASEEDNGDEDDATAP